MATELTERVLDALGPAFVELAGPLLPDLVDGLTGPLADIDALVAPTDRGWAAAFDVDATPQPAWLGQIVGTNVPAGLTLEEQRAYVRDRSRWKRGTPGAIRAAVAAHLTGSRRVELIERDGSPWRLSVRVYSAQLPPGAEPALLAAVVEQKPVGIVLDLVVATGATFAHMTAHHGPTFADYAAAFPTFADATAHVPEENT